MLLLPEKTNHRDNPARLHHHQPPAPGRLEAGLGHRRHVRATGYAALPESPCKPRQLRAPWIGGTRGDTAMRSTGSGVPAQWRLTPREALHTFLSLGASDSPSVQWAQATVRTAQDTSL